MITQSARNAVAYTRDVLVEHPDIASRDFHNVLLRDPVWYALMTKLWWLCAYDAPWGTGRYRHHDGYRT